MACIENIGVCVTQGNDWYMDITVTEDGTIDEVTGLPSLPRDLTGATVVFTLKETMDGAVVATPVSTVTDAEYGRISFTLDKTVTETLISAGEGSRVLYGAPQVTYQDGTTDDLFQVTMEIHESWN